MDSPTLQRLAERLRVLHFEDAPLVLPNAWDAASARAVATAGFPAVATTSGGVAACLGWSDGEQTPADEMFAAIGRMARVVDVPITADIESGYGLTPDELVDRLLGAGAVGCNLEDTDHRNDGQLVDREVQANRIASVKEAARKAGVEIVLNARVDVFIRKWGPADERLSVGLERASRYLEAGADCVYPIAADPDVIAAFVRSLDAPVNGMVLRGVTEYSTLRELGVARISFASQLHREAMKAATAMLERIAVGDGRL